MPRSDPLRLILVRLERGSREAADASQADLLETVQIWREDDQFVAHAMPVDVASSGDTPEEARIAVDEEVRAFLLAASEHGTLQEVLQDAGYRRGAGES